MSPDVDLTHLRQWIGREETAEDVLTAGLDERFRATLPLAAQSTPPGLAPRLIHFCLCQPVAAMSMLGSDGHPARGGFLPPVPLPRRMWAGSSIVFHGDLRIDDRVVRRSRVVDVTVKEGRSGALCFVTVDHAFTVRGDLRVAERQSIVYRADGPVPTATVLEAAPSGIEVVAIDNSPTLLFRYSALTFNGHRIHYDAPYATEVEGYRGLVVHGPLQATLLLHLAAQVAERPPTGFTFRSIATLYVGEELRLHAGAIVDGSMPMWTAREGGPIAMQAEARWS